MPMLSCRREARPTITAQRTIHPSDGQDMAATDLVLAMTGASGAPYGLRLLEVLLQAGRVVHLTMSSSAVEVLEHIGTPEVQRVLKHVAKESPEADLARAAEAALGRLTPARQP